MTTGPQPVKVAGNKEIYSFEVMKGRGPHREILKMQAPNNPEPETQAETEKEPGGGVAPGGSGPDTHDNDDNSDNGNGKTTDNMDPEPSAC
jgi:hypothetical protein